MSTVADSTAPAHRGRGRKPKTSPSSSLPEPRLTDVPLAESQSSTPPEPKRYTARKRMVIDGKTLRPGDEIPHADEIIRIEGWVRAGLVNEVTS